MTSTLRFLPEKTSYSVEEMPGHVVIPLEGGGSRKFQDLLLPGHIVHCQWLLKGTDYTEFMGFFNSELHNGIDDFLMDLITDIGIPTTHLCRTLGGVPALTQQKGDAYWVSCILQCDKNPTFTDTITYTALEQEAYWHFDGADQDIIFGDILDMSPTTSRTVIAWYRANADQVFNNPTFVSKIGDINAPGWRFARSASTNNSFRLRGQSANVLTVSPNPLPPLDGNWHQHAVTYSGSSLASGVQFLTDSVATVHSVGDDDMTAGATVSNDNDFIIASVNQSSEFFKGDLKHISIWDRVLTQGEIEQTYNGGSPPDLSNLDFFDDCIAWWKLNTLDTTNTDGVLDYSSSGFLGTPRNRDGVGASTDAATGQGQIVMANIGQYFREGDQIRIIDSKGIHPDGNIPLNLDGVYTVSTVVSNNIIGIDDPASVNSNWATLFGIDDGLADYGSDSTGNVISTVTKVPT